MSFDLSEYHEKEINKNFEKIESQIAKSSICENEYLQTIIEQMENLLTDTEKQIKNYRRESDMITENSKKIKELQNKFQSYQKKYKEIREKNKKYLNNSNNNNVDGFSYPNNNEGINSYHKIQEATRSTIEMENMSGNILTDLNGQSEKMKGVNSKIGGMNTDLNESNNLLGNILSRENNDIRIIILTGGVLSIIIVIFLIYKIMKIIM